MDGFGLFRIHSSPWNKTNLGVDMKKYLLSLSLILTSLSSFAAKTTVQNGETVDITVSNCSAGYYADAAVKPQSDSQLSLQVTCKPYICAYRKRGSRPINARSDSWIIFQAKASDINEDTNLGKKIYFNFSNTVLVERVDGSNNRNNVLQKLNAEGKCGSFLRVEDNEVSL
jgi:hypothetical protein